MCLLTLNREPEVAKGDIICYKMLLRDLENGRCYTPCKAVEVTIPGLVESKSKAIPCNYDSVMRCWVVEGEGVHAYVEREDAAVDCDDIRTIFFQPLVVQCRIPAGTDYWLGESGDIAARRMMIEKILNQYI